MTESKRQDRSKVQVKFRLPATTHKTLQAIAAFHGVSLTEVVNRALRGYVDSAKQGRTHG